MLTYILGDMFQSPAHVLVNTVNTVGVMGKGIAKIFKGIYPEMFKQYQELCESGKLTVGKLWLYKTPNKWILNFPTKTTWRQPSRLEYIEAGLEAFVKGYAEQGITSIAFPALGCGNGELNWEKHVHPLMEKYLSPLPIDIFIYVYRKGTDIPEHKNTKNIALWLRSEPESLGFEEVWGDLQKKVGTGIQLNSFYKERLFNVRCLEQEKGIQIEFENTSIAILYDELLSVWRIIRTYGFIFPIFMPIDVASYSDFLLALFVELPYCNEILISKNYKDLETPGKKGIQFVPRAGVKSPLINHPNGHLSAA